jgi:hypothetical protein
LKKKARNLTKKTGKDREEIGGTRRSNVFHVKRILKKVTYSILLFQYKEGLIGKNETLRICLSFIDFVTTAAAMFCQSLHFRGNFSNFTIMGKGTLRIACNAYRQ